jgi:hypothetical protein
VEFQARLAASLACAVLAESEAAPLWDWPEHHTFEHILAETEEAVDDLLVTNSAGARAFIQAKIRLQLSEGADSQLASALGQFARQFPSLQQQSQPDDRLVLAVGPRSSAPIVDVLPRILVRVQGLTADQPLATAARGKQEERVLRVVTEHLVSELSTGLGRSPSDDELKDVLRRLRVSVHDFDNDGPSLREAKSMLRQTVLQNANEAGRVWEELVSRAVRLSAAQGGTSRLLLQQELAILGVELRAAPSYREDIEALRRHTQQSLQRLSQLSSVQGPDGATVKIQRAAPTRLRDALDRQSVVVTGDPGAGKSATMFELAQLVSEARDVIALASDTLGAASLGELQSELALQHDIVEVLRNWPGVAKGILLVDALDAARGERTQEALLDLIGAVVNNASNRWRVAASIRRFDLRYNTDLQALFAATSAASEPEFQAAEFASLSHFNVPLLSDEELRQLEDLAPALHQLISSASEDLQSLARVPFNLRLLAELIRLEVDPREIEPIATQLQLLDKYWEHRVVRSGLGGDALEPVLRSACQEMVESRSMRIDRGVLQTQPTASTALPELLSSQVLVEEEFDGRVHREVVAYAHHVLFDYAVARLFFRGTERALLRESLDRPELLLIVRPSYDLHFRHLWEQDDRHQRFWDAALAVASEHELPEIGKIIAPGVAALLIQTPADAQVLVDALTASDDRTPAEQVLGHILGARLAESIPLPASRREVWASLLRTLARGLRAELLAAVTTLAVEFVRDPEQLEGVEREHVGAAARDLLEWVWQQPNYNGWVVGRAIEAVARTFETDAAASEDLLRRVLTRERLEEHGYQEMPELAGEAGRLVPLAPGFVRDVYATAFDFEETSDESTQMRTGVLALSSRKSQDYGHAHYVLGQAYSAFLRAAPDEAIGALTAVRLAYARKRAGRQLDEPVLHLDWSGNDVQVQPDGSNVWDSNGLDHDEEAQMLDAFEAWVTELADERPEAIEGFLAILRRELRPAALWRRVLLVASRHPNPFVPEIEPLVTAGEVLLSNDLSSLVGDFLSAAFPRFSPEARAHIESAVMRLGEAQAEDGSDDSKNLARYRGRSRDRLLGCLAEDALVTAPARERLQELLKANEVPENTSLSGFGGWTRSEYGEREILAEGGVDPDSPANQRLQRLEEPVKAFGEQHRNGNPPDEDVRSVEEPLRELWAAIHDAEPDGADQAQVEFARGYASAAAEAITRGHDMSAEHPALSLATEILLAAAQHPVPGSTDNPDFDDHPSWGSPAPRIEAAGGLPFVAIHAAAATEPVLSAIETLSADPSPAVRFRVAGRLHALRTSAPDLMWRIADRIAAHDGSTAVRQALVSTLPRMTLPDDVGRLETMLEAIFEGADGDRPGATKLRELCVEVMTDLFVWRNREAAGQFLQTRLVEAIPERADSAQHIVFRVRDAMTHGTVLPNVPEETAIRDRAIGLTIQLLERSLIAFAQLNEQLRGRADVAEDDPEFKTARTVARIIDGICMNLYFATGVFDEKQNKPTRTSMEQRARLYREAGQLLDMLPDAPLPTVTHHLLETLEAFVPFDPRGVFVRIGRTVRSGQAGAYETDSLGADLFVRLVERYLAEYRTLLQRDDECRQILVEILDIFVRAGWPQARKLTYGLQDIFR